MLTQLTHSLFITTLACASAACACPPGEENSSQDCGNASANRIIHLSTSGRDGAPGQVIRLAAQQTPAVAGQHRVISVQGVPLNGTASATSSGNSQTSSVVTVVDGDTTVSIVSKVTITRGDDGNVNRQDSSETKVTVDGSEVPQDRVKRIGSTLQVLDGSGRVIRTVEVPEMPSAPVAGGGQAIARALGSLQGIGRPGMALRDPVAVKGLNWNAWGSPPAKVMLGVTMEQPDASLAEHLKLNPNDVTVIGSITPDSPSAKAGLQKWDLIVSVDGQAPAPQAKIRDVLRQKDPGQQMTLGVISGGVKKDIVVTLEAYDAAKVGSLLVVPGSGDDASGEWTTDAVGSDLNELMERLRFQYDIDIDLGDLVAPASPRVAVPPGGPGAPPVPEAQPNSGFYRFRAPQSTSGDAERLRMMEEQLQAMSEMMQRMEERLAGSTGGAAGSGSANGGPAARPSGPSRPRGPRQPQPPEPPQAPTGPRT
ncbi:MAG: PDZ domain-containing protein [Phycisphaerae bacterium]|nr:PDZ domain-containing protein [Phycisphaerae bacterium]